MNGTYKTVCNDCGAILEEDEVDSFWELDYEYLGRPEYKTVKCCKFCGSDDLIEARVCEVCGEILEDDYSGLCHECILDSTNLSNCLKIGNRHKTEVPINEFITYCLSAEEINLILKKHIENNAYVFDEDISGYCNENVDSLVEIIKGCDYNE